MQLCGKMVNSKLQINKGVYNMPINQLSDEELCMLEQQTYLSEKVAQKPVQ